VADEEDLNAEQRREGAEEDSKQPARDSNLLTIGEVAQVLGVELIVAQTIADRGILPPDEHATETTPALWRRSRVEHLKKLRDAEARELDRLQAAEAETKPLKKRGR
jgi:hypothetical protein